MKERGRRKLTQPDFIFHETPKHPETKRLQNDDGLSSNYHHIIVVGCCCLQQIYKHVFRKQKQKREGLKKKESIPRKQ